MAAGEDRGHAGNAGYDDQVDAYYSWDSNDPNHEGPQVGDPVAVWDEQRLLGVSVIEHIDKHHGTKTLYRCPSCQRNRISARTRRAPRYRCSKCAHEFDIPVPQVIAVEKYTARYDAAWTGLDGLLGRAELAAVSHSSGDFNAIRRISWAGLCHELRVRGASLALDRVEARVDRQMVPEGLVVEFDHGFTTQVVRVPRASTVPQAPPVDAGIAVRLHWQRPRARTGGWTSLQLRRARHPPCPRRANAAPGHPSALR